MLHFESSAGVLARAFQRVISVTLRSAPLAPALTCFLLEVRDGVLSVIGSDDVTELRVVACKVERAMDGAFLVPARKINDLLKTLPADAAVTFDEEGDKSVIRTSKCRYTLASLPIDEFPQVAKLEGRVRVPVASDALQRLLAGTTFAMGVNDVRTFLNGLLLDLRGTELRCVATNGHRLAMGRATLSADCGNRQAIVPGKAAIELARLASAPGGVTGIELGTRYLRAEADDCVLMCRLIDGQYPNYDKVIPPPAPHMVEVDRAALLASLLRAAVLADERTHGVEFNVLEASLKAVAAGAGKDDGEAQEVVDAAVSGDPGCECTTVCVNYITQALAAMDTERVVFGFESALKPCTIAGAGDDRFEHVIMPLRL